MLSRCLNPACGTPFRYLREGRIFHVESTVTLPGNPEPERLLEHYWLCERCSRLLKVVVENGSVSIEPLHFEWPAVDSSRHAART